MAERGSWADPRVIARVLAALLLALTACACAQAEDPREPAVVTLRSGGMSVELQRAHSWSIQQIVFRGVPVGTRTGAFGAVVSVPVAGGWVGSGHTAGGVERVEEASLIVDGQFMELEDGATYTGERLVLQKRSMLDRLRLEATLTLTGGVLIERHELTATEDVVVSVTYPFMHPITSATTQWLAMTDRCEEISGEFGAGEDLQWHEGWAWTAAHIPGRSIGFVMRHIERPAEVPTLTAWWDQERYHKLYVRWGEAMEPWPEGLTLTGEIALGCFEAPPTGWREMARQVASELVAE